MAEIPEDLMKDAAHVAMRLWSELISADQVLTISRALLAERRATAERCAKIAERNAEDDDYEDVAHDIAAAIRRTVR